MWRNFMKKMHYPFGTITITDKAKKLVNAALDSGRVSGGKYVREFEKQFAKLVGTKEAVAMSSGTDADALALAVLYDFGAKRNDEIIVPSLSFAATGNAVLQAGFIPVFVDIDRHTLNINPEKIEEKITPKTRAVMPVHLMGKPADMDAIMAIAKKHKLPVIEDAAEAQSAVYKGKGIGTIGDMAAFSLYIAHIISTVEGGIVTTDNEQYSEILRSLRGHGRACKCESCVLNIGSNGICNKRFKYDTDIRFIFERIGYSAKMNELEAAVGLGYLEVYPEIYRKRNENFFYIRKQFKKFSPYLYTIDPGKNEEMAPYCFPVIIDTDKVRFKRDDFVGFLEKNGIDTRSLFLSMPTQCPGFKFLGNRFGQYPEAEYIGMNGFHVGIHQDITEEHMDYFIGLVDQYLKNKL